MSNDSKDNMTDRSQGQPFDERAALDALEQFQSEIKRYRQERETVANDFEEFVRTFPSPDDVFPAEKPTTPPLGQPPARPHAGTSQQAAPQPPRPQETIMARQPEARHQAPQAIGARDTIDRSPAAAPTLAPKHPAADAPTKPHRPSEPQAPVLSTPVSRRSKVPIFATLLIIVGVIAAIAYWNADRTGRIETPTAGDPTTGTPPPDTAASDTQPPSAPPPAAKPEPAPVTGSEITTSRPVWVRVIADGNRILERELPAGAKIPFTAEKTLVIRAGDAGAVRLILRGADHGTLGGDGDVVTRTFTLQDEQR